MTRSVGGTVEAERVVCDPAAGIAGITTDGTGETVTWSFKSGLEGGTGVAGAGGTAGASQSHRRAWQPDGASVGDFSPQHDAFAA